MFKFINSSYQREKLIRTISMKIFIEKGAEKLLYGDGKVIEAETPGRDRGVICSAVSHMGRCPA